MFAFFLYFLVPLVIFMLGVAFDLIIQIFMTLAGFRWSRSRRFIVTMIIGIIVAIPLAWYIQAIVDGRIRA